MRNSIDTFDYYGCYFRAIKAAELIFCRRRWNEVAFIFGFSIENKVAQFHSANETALWYMDTKISKRNLCDAFENINQFDAHKIDLFGGEEREEGNQHDDCYRARAHTQTRHREKNAKHVQRIRSVDRPNVSAFKCEKYLFTFEVKQLHL